MPEVVVNGRFLSRRVTGVERYGREILSFIGSRCRVERAPANGLTGHLWEQFVLPTKLASGSILWSPANTGPWVARSQALSIHDLTPLEHPEWFRRSFAAWYSLFLPLLARRVRVIFTPSAHVKQKVIERFGAGRVVVVPEGVNRSLFHPGAPQCWSPLPERFILFVGSLQPRKNLYTLLRAWDTIKEEYQDLWLIVAGEGGSVFKKIESLESERVQCIGYVSEQALPGLYAKATLAVLPSFDEGFGLPVLEAMACGTPVIVSDGGALPETVGEAGLIVKASDVQGWSDAVRTCLEDQNLYLSLVDKGLERAKQFSWQVSAGLVWDALHAI